MRLALCCIAAIACAPVAAHADPTFDYAAWDHLLKTYVDDQGRVDYARLRASKDDRKRLDALVAEIAAADVTRGSLREREAFLVDAYNVLVWKRVLERAPARIDEDSFAFFRESFFVVAGRTMSLDRFEKELILPNARQPLVHFALNCASMGCPELPREAFTPAKLDEQLAREATKFCNETRNVTYDPVRKHVTFSMLFKWYSKAFDDDPIGFCNARRPSNARIAKDAVVDYWNWDWRLNDRSSMR